MSFSRKKGERHQEQTCVLETLHPSRYPIIVLDNGSYAIKAGFAGQAAPVLCLQNCAVQPFGRRQGGIGTHLNASAGTGGSSGIHGSHSTSSAGHSASGKHSGLIAGDDIYGAAEYYCLRPFRHGLLLDSELQTFIWDKMFSKPYLNISDRSSNSLLVTEHCNAPAVCRYTLTQIVFEEFGFDHMVISPGQQLVPFSFNVGEPPQQNSFSESRYQDVAARNKTRRGQHKDFGSVKSWFVGDPIPVPSVCPRELVSPVCQLVVDVGHQTTWIVPLYGETPLEAAIMRIDLGGVHVSSLLRHLLCYRQIDLERNELLVHHIKEEGCTVSLNYLADLRLARSRLSIPSACGPSAVTHLTHRYYLPNEVQKNMMKRFFKTSRHATLPQYEPDGGDRTPEAFRPVASLPTPLPDLISFSAAHEEDDDEADCASHQDPAADAKLFQHSSDNLSTTSNWSSQQGYSGAPRGSGPSAGVVYMNVERIKPPELLFYPSDYNFADRKPGSCGSTLTSANGNGSGTLQGITVSGAACHRDAYVAPSLGGHTLSALETLQPPNPSKQCGIAEGIERAIFACPPVIQSRMAERILLCGGSSGLPNFAQRLYMELRSRLPQAWCIRILQQESPAFTTWIGGSVWAASNDSSNYYTFALSRAQYEETG